MGGHDSKALMYDFSPKVWKRFTDDIFVVWTHDTAQLPSFLNYLNSINDTRKTEFTMHIADDVNGFQVFDLKLKCLNGKLSVVFILSLQIVLPTLCHQRAIQ